MADVSLEMLQALIQKGLDEQRIIRNENNQLRSIMLDLVDQVRRLDRRIGEVKDDIELMVKAELMGRLGRYKMTMDARLAEIEERLGQRP